MKVIQIDEYGGPEVLKYREVADPAPGTGEALVDIQAVGVNFTDTYSRAGINPVPRLPWIIGVEAAGHGLDTSAHARSIALSWTRPELKRRAGSRFKWVALHQR